MVKELDALKLENSRLRDLAEHDSLTGLYNRGTMEEKISKQLKEHVTGVFLMIDIDEFKYINDHFGHLTGDRTLQELARVMKYYFFFKDIIGRMGGDEFAVFLPGEHTKELVKSKVESLNARIAQAGEELGIRNRFRITVGASFTQEGDTFQSLYERADIAMRAGKNKGKTILVFHSPSLKGNVNSGALEQEPPASAIDMKYISGQLKETNITMSTYCQDYDTFLSIYRFLERGLSRTGLKVHLILLTLTDQWGSFVPLEEREALMEKLRESVCSSLRFSDIYTQYSSCQYLAMVPGATQENMDVITNRIQADFRARLSNHLDVQLSFGFYPLQPVIHGKQKAGTAQGG